MSFKGDTGPVWVKIDQLSYNPAANPPWASDLLREQGAKWTVTIPPKLAPGEYLLRHEILGLHVAETRMGAQFYPSCTQIRVTSGGTTQLPSGVALPGAYKPDDTKGVSEKNSRMSIALVLGLGLRECSDTLLDPHCPLENSTGSGRLRRPRRPGME